MERFPLQKEMILNNLWKLLFTTLSFIQKVSMYRKGKHILPLKHLKGNLAFILYLMGQIDLTVVKFVLQVSSTYMSIWYVVQVRPIRS